MNKTRLFISKTPTLNNSHFNDYDDVALQPGEQPHPLFRRYEYWDIRKVRRNNTTPDGTPIPGATWDYNLYDPVVVYPSNQQYDSVITEDIGAQAGIYKIAIEVEVFDDTQPYSGQFCIGIGGRHGYLYNGEFVEPLNYQSGEITTPGEYIFTIDVSKTDLDPNRGTSLDWRYQNYQYIKNNFWIIGSGIGFDGGNYIDNIGIKSVRILNFYPYDYKEVDTYDDIKIPITYSVADVRDISKKDSNWSLTIDLPNTKNNGELFDCIHEISDYNSSFELLKEYPCFVEVDGNRTFEGFLQMTKVNINMDKEVSYECNLHSNVIDFIDKLGDYTLRGNEDSLQDLDFSSGTEIMTSVVFENKLLNQPDHYWDNGKYNFGICLIDKTDKNKEEYNGEKFILDPNGFVYPWFLDETTPFVYIKDIFDAIFDQTGYSYVSTFLGNIHDRPTINSNNYKRIANFDFSKLVYPRVNIIDQTLDPTYSILKLNDESGLPYYSNEIYNYDGSSNQLSLSRQYCMWKANSGLYFDENKTIGSFTAPGGKFKMELPSAGKYNIKVNIPFTINWQIASPGSLVPSGETRQMSLDSSKIYGLEFSVMLHQSLQSNEVLLAKYTTGLQYYDGQRTLDVQNGFVDFMTETIELDTNFFAQPNDYIYLRIDGFFDEKDPDDNWAIYFNTGGGTTVYREILQATFEFDDNLDDIISVNKLDDWGEDGIFDPTVILNQNTKKKDFINDIIKKFNLYIEDVSFKKDDTGTYYRDYLPNGNDKIFRIEPRDVYYNNGVGLDYTVLDLTDNIDAKSIVFNRLEEYLYKDLDFIDKNDKDYWIDSYNSNNYTEGEYGECKISAKNSGTNRDTLKISSNFGQTAVGPQNSSSKSVLIPKIVSFTDNGEIKTDKEYSDRMLFLTTADIMQSISTSEIIGLYGRSDGNDFTSLTPRSLLAQYNYVGTFNNPFSQRTIDLNWYWCNWYYEPFLSGWSTPNNLYDVFWRGMIDNFNDKNSRLVSCVAYLPQTLIHKLKLSDTIIVNSMAYHINKIKEWSSENEPCELELIRVLDSNSTPGIIPSSKNNYNHIISTPINYKPEIESLHNNISTLKKSIEDKASEASIIEIKKLIINIDERLKKLESGK